MADAIGAKDLTLPLTPSRIAAMIQGDEQAPPALPAPQVNERLEAARALAKQNPAAVAGIMRGWVSPDAA